MPASRSARTLPVVGPKPRTVCPLSFQQFAHRANRRRFGCSGFPFNRTEPMTRRERLSHHGGLIGEEAFLLCPRVHRSRGHQRLRLSLAGVHQRKILMLQSHHVLRGVSLPCPHSFFHRQQDALGSLLRDLAACLVQHDLAHAAL